MRFLSPLRYPGGKGRLGPYFARILASQSFAIETYCEPYAGGAGAGLYLLLNQHVETLIINDLNPGVAAFWRAIKTAPGELMERIMTVNVTMDEWHRQREVYLNPERAENSELGFATFFLNRCNRSGILSARPIGGLEQTGQWKIDARFNRIDLARRVEVIAGHADNIDVREIPAIDLVRSLNRRSRKVLMYVDPPYVVQGEELYLRSHTWDEHEDLADQLARSHHPWVLTYDVDERTRRLYDDVRCLQFGIKHTAHVQKVGQEYMFFSRGLRVPDRLVLRSEGEWVRAPADSAS